MNFYVVMNDDGEYADPSGLFGPYGYGTTDKDEAAENAAKSGCGHVVELAEAPAKVVVSEAEAKILEGAKKDKHPCMYIAWKVQVDDEDRLMRAYVNGYTVAKEKRYQLKVPYADGWIFQKYSPESKLKHHNRSDTFPVRDTGLSGCQLELTWFTEAEIEHYGLHGCERVGVTDDDD